MKKFVLILIGGIGHADADPELREKWGTWFKSIGEHLVDSGSPLVEATQKEVSASGTVVISEDTPPAIGYLVISVEDFAAAEEIAKQCPMIVADQKDAMIRVCEAEAM